MSTISGSAKDNATKTTFWKKGAKMVPGSIKPVYGAQHPPMKDPGGLSAVASGPSTPTRREKVKGHRDAFRDFEEKTNDAWDDAEDDLMVMSDIRLSRREVQNTAMQVLNNHSQQSRTNQLPKSQSQSEESTNPNKFNTQSSNSSSAPCTPSHSASVRPGPTMSHLGPGIGVRLNTHWQIPRVSPTNIGQMPVPDRESSKLGKFKHILESGTIELEELRKLSWSGIPEKFRPLVWKILSGYLPPMIDRQDVTLQRKRQEYYNFLEQYLETRHQEPHQHTFRQIQIDIPRMSPLIALFQQKVVQEIFERILYIWAIRHPASGYVQGINDLVTPFFVVFLTEYISPETDVATYHVENLAADQLKKLEADSFWCFSKLLDGIQDNYTFAQPGIQMRVQALYDLISRIDSEMHVHLCSQHIEYLQFAFRWMNNLLMREIPLSCVIHLWDTYLSEPEGFANFHLYVCAAFLLKFSKDLQRQRDFQGLMLLLQNLPTQNWVKEDVDLLVAEAFKLKYMFADAPRHLAPKISQ